MSWALMGWGYVVPRCSVILVGILCVKPPGGVVGALWGKGSAVGSPRGGVLFSPRRPPVGCLGHLVIGPLV